MRPMRWDAFAFRLGVWLAAAVASTYMVRNPTPTLDELLTIVPVVVVLTSISGLSLLILVRTWTGTLVASAGFLGTWMWLVAYIDSESERSSTAGVGILALPIVTLVPVMGVYIVEQLTFRDLRSMPPPPMPPLP